MEVPKSVTAWAIGLVLLTVAFLAGQNLLSTQSLAATANEVNTSQDKDIAILKAQLSWQREALKMLLKERGLIPPPPK